MLEQELKIIYEVKAGSHAYGTSTPKSDEDFRGIAVAPMAAYLGCGTRFEQLEIKEPDRVIYDLIKFCSLALDGNPNIIELLYTDDSDVVTITKSGQKLRQNRDLFLSKRVRWSFCGYAFSQIKRIRTHRQWLLHPLEKKPERKDFGLPEHKTVPLDQQEAFIWMCSRAISDTLEEAKLTQETRQELMGVNFHGCLQSRVPDEIWPALQQMTGASDNFIYAMKQERAYSNELAQWKSYQNWKETRNHKRAELEKKCGFDCKHGYHAVRLIREGFEILRGEGVKVKRPDAEELLFIRNGGWSFEQLEDYCNGMEVKFEELYKTSSLPKEPNRKRVSELCQEILCDELYADIVVNLL